MTTQVHEAAIALEWLLATLRGDNALTSIATGGVHRAMASLGTVPPYIIVANQAGVDVLTANAVRLMNNSLYQVKAVGPAAMTDTLMSAAAEIDALFKRADGTATGGLILSCYRESPLQLDELRASGEQWSNVGGLYRLLIQQTS